MFSPRTLIAPVLTAAVGLGSLLSPAQPARADRWDHDRHGYYRHDRDFRGGVRIDLGRPAYAPGGYWVDQPQTVCVVPGHYETRYTAPVYQQGVDAYGRPVTVAVNPGGAAQVWVPPVYETRMTRVWVPAPAPRCDGGPRFSIGVRF